MTMPSKVTIEFDNKDAAYHFMSWLDGQGEQDYWTWMKCREDEEPGNITAESFLWGYPQSDPAKYRESQFTGNDLIVKAKCGRLSH